MNDENKHEVAIEMVEVDEGGDTDFLCSKYLFFQDRVITEQGKHIYKTSTSLGCS